MVRPSYLLNGCAGSGKSTLVEALQRRASYPLMHLGLDGWLAFQGQAKWNRFPDKQAVWDRMLDAFHATIAATIDAGVSVVVDHVLQEKRWLPLLAPLLAPLNVYFIGVTCPASVAQTRIDARGHADSETIPFQLARIHGHGTYDLVVDTSESTAEELAAQLLDLPRTTRPGAFRLLAEARGGDAMP